MREAGAFHRATSLETRALVDENIYDLVRKSMKSRATQDVSNITLTIDNIFDTKRRICKADFV